MKVCTRCKIEKEDEDFRKRQSVKKGKIYPYRNPTCRKCDKELAVEYREKNKDSQKYRERNRLSAKKGYYKNREKILEREKERKRNGTWTAYMKKWYSIPENKIRTRQLSNKRNKKYNKKNMEELNDMYIISLLTHPRNNIPRKIVRENKDFIELMKINIKLKREIYGK